ncbi:MAG: hypothetical protein WBQ72_06235 [Terriglobales bacterium]
MNRDDNNSTFAIILHNVRTYRSAGVIEVVRGMRKAELTLKEFQSSQNPAEYHEGWRYFFEKTELAAGTDPAQATHLRQADLELRESKQPQEPKFTIRASSNHHK